MRLTRTHRTLFVVVAGAFVMANAWGAGPLDQAIAEATKANKASSKSQDKVEKVDDERSDIVAGGGFFSWSFGDVRPRVGAARVGVSGLCGFGFCREEACFGQMVREGRPAARGGS